eukprot:11890010-Alexandrium_andersonii.AAC.1
MGRKVVALLDSGAAVNAATEELIVGCINRAGLWVRPEGSGVPGRAVRALQRERGGHWDRQRPRCA